MRTPYLLETDPSRIFFLIKNSCASFRLIEELIETIGLIPNEVDASIKELMKKLGLINDLEENENNSFRHVFFDLNTLTEVKDYLIEDLGGLINGVEELGDFIKNQFLQLEIKDIESVKDFKKDNSFISEDKNDSSITLVSFFNKEDIFNFNNCIFVELN